MNKKVLIAAGIALAFFIVVCCATTAKAEEYRPAWEIDSLRYQQYCEILENATEADIIALEQTLYNEACCGLCEHDENCAVMETILNRVISSNWPNSIYDVCHQENQFCCKPYKNKKNYLQYKWQIDECISDTIADEWNGRPYVLPTSTYTYFAKGQQKKYAHSFIFVGTKKDGMWFGIGKDER